MNCQLLNFNLYRSIVIEELVLWHIFGVTHYPRPEDWYSIIIIQSIYHSFPTNDL